MTSETRRIIDRIRHYQDDDYFGGTMTAREIAKVLYMSRADFRSHMQTLVDEGHVKAQGTRIDADGQKRTAYRMEMEDAPKLSRRGKKTNGRGRGTSALWNDRGSHRPDLRRVEAKNPSRGHGAS